MWVMVGQPTIGSTCIIYTDSRLDGHLISGFINCLPPPAQYSVPASNLAPHRITEMAVLQVYTNIQATAWYILPYSRLTYGSLHVPGPLVQRHSRPQDLMSFLTAPGTDAMEGMGQGHFTGPNTITESNPAILNTIGEFPSFDRRRLGHCFSRSLFFSA